MRWPPAALLTTAAVACAYALGAAPGLTWLDAGELGAAAWELGVAHPPGAPVFALLHKAVMLAVPVGDAAFRGNVASGLLVAVTVNLILRAARALEVGPGPAVIAVVWWATAPLTWLHGTTIEVYTGATAAVAALCWLIARLAATGDARWALAVALLGGLMAGHHPALRLIGVAALPALLPTVRRRPRLAVGLVVTGLVGAACLIYLPVRAAQQPWRNWGDPSTLGALWDHWSGARIRLAFADQFGHFSTDAWATAAQQLAEAPLLLAFGLPGLALLARRPGGWLPGALFALDLLYATSLNPMGLADRQNLLPGLVGLALGAAAALAWAATRVATPAGRVVGGMTAVAAGLLSIGPPIDRRDDRALPALVRALDDGLPPEALALVASDNFAAGLAFVQVVEGARPDVAVIVRQHIWDASSIHPVRRRLPAALVGWRPGAGLATLGRLRADWPLAWEWAGGLDAAARPALDAHFPLPGRGLPELSADRLAPPGHDARPPPPPERALTALLGWLPGDPQADPQARRGLAGLCDDLGQLRLAAGNVEDAPIAFARAASLDPDRASRWSNLGSALARAGRSDASIWATQRALTLDPNDRTAGRNLVRYLLAAGASARARAAVDDLLARHPRDADGLALRGVLKGNAGDLAGARADFEAALAVDPAQAEARAGLAHLRRLQGPRPR